MQPEFVELIPFVSVLLLALAQWVAWRRQRRALADTRAEIERARRDLAALIEAGHGLGRRVVAQQSELRRIGSRSAAVAGGAVPASRLELAAALVRQGVSPEVVAERCALTRSEAELLTRLQAARRAA